MATSSLAKLIAAIPPPKHPCGISRGWDAAEHELKLSLPGDYKHFISAYGTGGFFPFELFVWNLLEENLNIEFIRSQNEFAHDAENDSVSLQRFGCSTPVFPFGADGVGSEFFWAQNGSPENWYVIVVKGGLKYHRLPDLSLTGFLVALLLDHDPKLISLWGDDGTVGCQTFRPAPASSSE